MQYSFFWPYVLKLHTLLGSKAIISGLKTAIRLYTADNYAGANKEKYSTTYPYYPMSLTSLLPRCFPTDRVNRKYWRWVESSYSHLKKKKKILSYKSAYKHYFWVSELNKPSEHSVKRIHLNGQECLSVMGGKSTEGIKGEVCSWADIHYQRDNFFYRFSEKEKSLQQNVLNTVHKKCC